MGHSTPDMAIRYRHITEAATRSSPHRWIGSSRPATAPIQVARTWHGAGGSTRSGRRGDRLIYFPMKNSGLK